jgi:hypothetical protein
MFTAILIFLKPLIPKMQEHARPVIQHYSTFYTQGTCALQCHRTDHFAQGQNNLQELTCDSFTQATAIIATYCHRQCTQCSRLQVWHRTGPDPSFNPDCIRSWQFSVIKEKLFCLKNREMLDQPTFNISYKAPVEQESSWASGEDRWAAGIAWR